MDVEDSCLWCCQPASEKCPHCQQVAFCSKTHYQNHLGPAGQCLPFRIRHSPTKGRYAEAVRDIQPTELILLDEPLVIGPSRQQQIVCVECLKPCDGSLTCTECQLPLCQHQCQRLTWHSIECGFLQEQGFKAAKMGVKWKGYQTDLPTLLVQLAAITPLRLLLKGLHQEKSYQDLKKPAPLYDFYSTETSPGSRSAALENDMVTTLWSVFGLSSHVSSPAIVRQAIGQLFNNAKSLERPGHNGSALYGRYCLLNHCCVSNAKCIITNDANKSTFPLEVRAQTLIKRGEEITTRYVGINVGSPLRSLMLNEHWSFTCQCKRCMDPTELGTLASALRCTQCPQGLLLPAGSVPAAAGKWCCDHCPAYLEKAQVETIIEGGLRIIKNNTSDPPEVKLLQHVIEQLSHIFHTNHYLVMQVKFVLLKLLVASTNESTCMDEWSRISSLSLELLQLINRLDPGASRNRGQILKDLIKPWMKIAQHQYQTTEIDEKEFTARKLVAQGFAKDLITCYKYENMAL